MLEDRGERLRQQAWKRLNTLTSRWPGGEAELCSYTASHRTFHLRITTEGREGNLMLTGRGCKFLSGPTRWKPAQLEFACHPAAKAEDDIWFLWDTRAGFMSATWDLQADENVKRFGRPNVPRDLTARPDDLPAPGDEAGLLRARDDLERWSGNPAQVLDYDGPPGGRLEVRIGPTSDYSRYLLLGIADCRYFSGPTTWDNPRIELTFDPRSRTYVVRDAGSSFIAVGAALVTRQFP